MKNRCAEITEWLRKAVWILFAVIIGYLLISSIFSTCYLWKIEYITNSENIEMNMEHAFYLRDMWWIHFIIFIFTSGICVYLKRAGADIYSKRISILFGF